MDNKVFAGFTAGEYDVPMVDNVRNGKGTQKYSKGDEEYTLECTWVNGKKHGEGILLDSNYIMAMKFNFVEDVVEGEGYLYSNGQTTFKGMWKNGMRCGFGQEFEGGRLIFKGEYENDLRNGYGILYDSNQEIIFEGMWVNGEQGRISIAENDNGDREMTEKNENGSIVYIGGFKEGTVQREGKGVEYNEEGLPAKESYYKDGVEERKIKEFKGNSIVIYDGQGKKMYEGEYLQDKGHRYPPHGKGRLFNGTVMVYFGDFVKGKREGHGCSYHMTRCLQYEGDWMNDMANGLGKYHNEEGHLIADGEFHDNVYEDDKIRIFVDSGKVEDVKSGGCACFGSARRAKTKQLPSMYDEDSTSDANAIKSMKELTALPNSATVIRIAANSMNEETTTVLDLNRFSNLRRLIIGDHALTHLKELVLREMRYLKYVEIGDKSCSIPELSATLDKQYTIKENAHSLSIESCPALEEIVVGNGACADFIRFSLIDLPALKTLTIGTADNNEATRSNNFYFCEKLTLRDLPMLQSVVLGNYSFQGVNNVLIKDLPALTSLTLGSHACQFIKDLFEREDTNKMEVRNLSTLSELILYTGALQNMIEFKIVETPMLNDMEKVKIEGECFTGLKSFKYGENVPDSFVDRIEGVCNAKIVQIKKKSS